MAESSIRNRWRTARRLGIVMAAAVAVTACAAEVRNRGNLVEDRRLEQIQVGTSTAGDVLAHFRLTDRRRNV